MWRRWLYRSFVAGLKPISCRDVDEVSPWWNVSFKSHTRVSRNFGDMELTNAAPPNTQEYKLSSAPTMNLFISDFKGSFHRFVCVRLTQKNMQKYDRKKSTRIEKSGKMASNCSRTEHYTDKRMRFFCMPSSVFQTCSWPNYRSHCSFSWPLSWTKYRTGAWLWRKFGSLNFSLFSYPRLHCFYSPPPFISTSFM